MRFCIWMRVGNIPFAKSSVPAIPRHVVADAQTVNTPVGMSMQCALAPSLGHETRMVRTNAASGLGSTGTNTGFSCPPFPAASVIPPPSEMAFAPDPSEAATALRMLAAFANAAALPNDGIHASKVTLKSQQKHQTRRSTTSSGCVARQVSPLIMATQIPSLLTG